MTFLRRGYSLFTKPINIKKYYAYVLLMLAQSSCGQNLKYTKDFMTIWKFVRQYSWIASQRTKLSAVMAQSLNPNHVSFISSEAKPKLEPLLDISEKDNEKFQKLMLPYVYVKQMPKEHVMDLLTNGINHWLKLPQDKVKAIEDIYSDFYDYGILVDDWVDGSASRRDHPSAHRIYGPKKTLLSSTAVLLRIIEKLKKFDSPMASRSFEVAILNFSMGQNEELSWLTDSKYPTMSEYYDFIRIKTGCFIDFVVEAIQSMSEYKQDLSTVVKLYCQYLQFQNDYCNLYHEQYWKSKGFGDDISTGKFTLPIVHAINSGTMEGEIVLNIIRQCTTDVDMIKYCSSLLEKLGSFEYAKQIVFETEEQCRAEIDRLGGNETFEKMIDKINLWKNDEKYTVNE